MAKIVKYLKALREDIQYLEMCRADLDVCSKEYLEITPEYQAGFDKAIDLLREKLDNKLDMFDQLT